MGLGLGALALVGFVLVTELLGTRWGLLLLGAVVVAAVLVLGMVFVKVRKQGSYLRRQTSSATGIAERSKGVAEKARASTSRLWQSHKYLRSKVADLEQARANDLKRLQAKVTELEKARRRDLDAVQREIRTSHDLEIRAVQELGNAVHGRLDQIEAAYQRFHTYLVSLRAEEHAGRNAEGAAMYFSPEAEVDLIRSSVLFDEGWYRARSGVQDGDLVAHYVSRGARAGLDPHPLFNATWYLEKNPDALEGWRTPLAHFLVEGEKRDLDPHPAFWSKWYVERHLDAAFRGLAIEHFLSQGGDALHDPNPLFHTRWYVDRYRKLIPPGVNPLVHYVTGGAEQDLDPSPLFDTAEVRRRIGGLDGDPLTSFLAAQQRPEVRLREPDPTHVKAEPSESDRKWEYLIRGRYREPDTFVLYRIIGNDLPPRHRAGQSLDNLRFILAHEPALPNCEKRWVVNRIVDPTVEKQIISLLEEHGMGYTHIPFDYAEYRDIRWRFGDFDPPGLTFRKDFGQLNPRTQLLLLDHVYHDKNLYIMNNNGARNAALRQGRRLAKWVLPWDGNCFVTRQAWAELTGAVSERPYLKYFSVPMARILDNQALLQPDPSIEATEEPQLLFRTDAEEGFNPDARYGRRPKVDLFYRIGLGGPWDSWEQKSWEPQRPSASPNAGPVGRAGWVARLFSGEGQLEGDLVDRGKQRRVAVLEMIDRIDEKVAGDAFDAAALFALDDRTLRIQSEQYGSGEPGPAKVVRELTARAEQAMDQPVYSVVSKTSVAPSGELHDYWHPAPYWWPNPDTPDGLPYVRRDGERVPGTVLWEEGSERYDRSSLQSMIDETAILTLAGFFTRRERYFTRAARLLRAWFVDSSTRMNPHLKYAQVRRGHNGDVGTRFGVIETNDFYYLLDAARLLEREGALGSGDAALMREWFAEFRGWLRESVQGQEECASLNNHGTWYDVQVAAIDSYLGDFRGLLETMRRSHERVWQQFGSDGSQPEELARTQSQHYCAYNLQGWATLAGFSRRVGQDLWRYRTGDGRGLAGAARWLLGHVGKPWPSEQLEAFDADRLVVLANEMPADVSGEAGAAREPLSRDPWDVKQVFTPHDGIRPFWLLASPVER